MIKMKQLRHRFVETMPEKIDPGTLYISMEYATAAHRCCCGCGEEVVTPFSPAQWKMTFDGDAVSLHPSIGNWNLRCRSHYVVREGRVIDAGGWTDEQIEDGRKRDNEARTKYLADKTQTKTMPSTSPPAGRRRSRLGRLIDLFKLKFV
ncbi:DUF6527 family protein [Bradyrhizobium sp. CCBAU 51627]|uniref:DUF6527 family protein n=1 Tax=Bradyrhizobium sp. CCBAU 51627 TaxID=1325088 RepID=UPI0023056D2C|nr:DUF6527 family protein [Bradyrhizobium sp. CCBAU 51627]MDA9436280.1 hypothetical protein [Bradyrhizobium sp. CCBAU 51627]